MSGFVKDVHTVSVALTQTAISLVQLVGVTADAMGEGMAYLWSDSPPDRSTEIPLETYVENGQPVVRWIAERGNDFHEWSDTHWYEVVAIEQWHATICPRGNLVMTCMPLYQECRWRELQHSGEAQSVWGMPEVPPEIGVRCDLPVTDLRSFTVESSVANLSAQSASLHRANRLWHTEHQCLRGTFAGGVSGMLSECQRSPRHAREVAFALNGAFTGRKLVTRSPSQAPDLI